MTRAFESLHARWIACLLVAAKIWFVMAQPMVAIGGAGHDDRLFFELADRIQRGVWLGDYNQYTLMKGPGYPLLIAGAFKAGIPLPIAEHALYIFGCWMVIGALRPLLRRDRWALAIFALLLWQPMSFAMGSPAFGNSSVVRQNLYTPLTLLIFAGLAGSYTRRAARPWVRAYWASLLGLSFGWFWLTREESIWIAPSVVLLTGVMVAAAWGRRNSWWRISWPMLLATMGALAPILTVCTLNLRHYGWFGTVEFRAPQFIAAYGALTRVKAGDPVFRVPVTKAARLKTYEVSPAFAELKPLVEGEIGRRWGSSLESGWHGETNGAMWMWELRDAVVESGHQSAPAVLAFYQRIADDVNAACDSGRIPSYGPRRDTFLPPWNAQYAGCLRAEWRPFARQFLEFRDFSARPSRSQGNASLLEIFRDLGGWTLSRSDEAPELNLPRSMALKAWRIGALQDIGTVLCFVCRWMVPLGAIAWLANAGWHLWSRRLPGYLWWFATACLGGATAVFVIALLIDVTSWGDTRPLRFAEAYPLILLFASVAVVELFSTRSEPIGSSVVPSEASE